MIAILPLFITLKLKLECNSCSTLDPSKFQHTCLGEVGEDRADRIKQLRAPIQVITYADNITSTRTYTSAANKYIQPYLHNVFAWTKQNNLTLNADETTCIRLTPHAAEYISHLDLNINNTALHMAKIPGLTLDPKLTCSTLIHNIPTHTHKSLLIIKAFTATGWGKPKETLMARIRQS